MTSPAFSATRDGEVESRWAQDLAAADRALASVEPRLRHALEFGDHDLLNDRIAADVRARLEDLAGRLAGGERADAAGASALVDALAADRVLLRHIHALAVEAQLADRLAERVALDPVVPPLLRTLIGSPDPETAVRATELVDAQARFVQAQRRGELAVADLPREARAAISRVLEANGLEPPREVPGAAMPARRLELIESIAGGLPATAALDVMHAGVALFASALARAANLDRDTAILTTCATQLPRLALALVAAGATRGAAERQILVLHPDAVLPESLASLGAEQAAALLAGASG